MIRVSSYFHVMLSGGGYTALDSTLLLVASTVQDKRGWKRFRPAYLPYSSQLCRIVFVLRSQLRSRLSHRCIVKNTTYIRSTKHFVYCRRTYGVGSRHTYPFAPEASGAGYAVSACALVSTHTHTYLPTTANARHGCTAQQVMFCSVFDSPCCAGIGALRTPPTKKVLPVRLYFFAYRWLSSLHCRNCTSHG